MLHDSPRVICALQKQISHTRVIHSVSELLGRMISLKNQMVLIAESLRFSSPVLFAFRGKTVIGGNSSC